MDLDAMQAFVRIVEHGSLSAAGRAMRVPKATLSRKLADLERTLGAALLRRSTRALTLTPAGRALFDRVAPLLAEASRAADEIKGASAEPAGLVRVSAALGFGQTVLLPIVARFMEEHPKVRVELVLSEEPVRIVDGGFDLAIRMGRVEETDMTSRRLARIERGVFASKAYVKAHGRPRSVAELAGHALIVASGRHAVWRFDDAEIRVKWRVAAGGMTALVDAARLGMGIAMLPKYMVEPFDDLVEIDLDTKPSPADVTALFPKPTAAVRALLDRITKELASNPAFSGRRRA